MFNAAYFPSDYKVTLDARKLNERGREQINYNVETFEKLGWGKFTIVEEGYNLVITGELTQQLNAILINKQLNATMSSKLFTQQDDSLYA